MSYFHTANLRRLGYGENYPMRRYFRQLQKQNNAKEEFTKLKRSDSTIRHCMHKGFYKPHYEFRTRQTPIDMKRQYSFGDRVKAKLYGTKHRSKL